MLVVAWEGRVYLERLSVEGYGVVVGRELLDRLGGLWRSGRNTGVSPLRHAIKLRGSGRDDVFY